MRHAPIVRGAPVPASIDPCQRAFRAHGYKYNRWHLARTTCAGQCREKGVQMKAILIAAGVAVSFAAAGTAHAQEALAKSSGCMTCHDVSAKKVGPAFKDVAAKYKGKPDAEATLVAKLSAAKEHPAVKAKGDDLKSLVKWVVSM
jgi:cytochrome c